MADHDIRPGTTVGATRVPRSAPAESPAKIARSSGWLTAAVVCAALSLVTLPFVPLGFSVALFVPVVFAFVLGFPIALVFICFLATISSCVSERRKKGAIVVAAVCLVVALASCIVTLVWVAGQYEAIGSTRG